MIVKTISGSQVSFMSTDHKGLMDSNGVYWKRNPSRDVAGHAAYTETKNNIETALFSVPDLVRVCSGDDAMRNPTNLEEMYAYAIWLGNRPTYPAIKVVSGWGDKHLLGILEEAQRTRQSAGALLEKYIREELQKDEESVIPTTASSVASVESELQSTPSGIPKKKAKREYFFVQTEHISVQLTSKQLEFIERLSENPDWEEFEMDGEYLSSQYAEELSGTMNSMTVGAVITTLREKKLLVTTKKKIGAIKCSYFRLTELGKEVYEKLANKTEV